MNGMTVSISMVPKNTPAAGQATVEPHCCGRCGGLLVDERCMDIGESMGGYWFWAMRCIQCGDIVDEVILRNRSAQMEPAQVVRAA